MGELVFIGNAMNEAEIRETLAGILLTDEEFALGPEVWTQWKKIISNTILYPEDKGRDTEFTMDLVKKDGDIVGFQVDETEDIIITYVNPGGLVHKWNTEHMKSNPELVVRVGYSVKDVNGVKGVNGMKSIRSSTHLKFTISRVMKVAQERRFMSNF